jgi:hypothetical protein
MYLHTDALAVLVGWHVRNEREIILKDRVPEIRARLLKPAKTLLGALESVEFSKEFRVTWGGFKEVDTVSLANELKKLIAGVPKHIDTLKSAGARGKGWDSDLKDHFIKKVAFLCEFLDPHFEPTIKYLNRPAYLLAAPLFKPDPKKNEPFLKGAIAKFVRNFRPPASDK